MIFIRALLGLLDVKEMSGQSKALRKMSNVIVTGENQSELLRARKPGKPRKIREFYPLKSHEKIRDFASVPWNQVFFRR